MSRSEVEEVRRVVVEAFEAGRLRDFGVLARLHWNDAAFAKFDDSPPFRRQGYREAVMHEEAAFAGIGDYHYELEDLEIHVFGEVALATFYVKYGGVVVDNYSFRGQTFEAESRVSMVLVQRGGGWLILHEHLSRIPDARSS